MTIARSLPDIAAHRVLVTGASGFLGTHLRRRLRASGAEVHGVSRRTPSGDAEAISWECADLTDEAAVRSILQRVRPDIVFHLSGHGGGAPDLHNVLPTFRSDLMTTVNVLTFATELRVSRIVLAASLEEPSPQDADVPPASPYAAAKWSSSMYSRMFHLLYGTPVATVRPFMTYGPGQQPHKLVPYVILSLLQSEAPKLSSGQRGVDWIYVEDVIDGMLAAALAPGVEGVCFDLGSGELVSIKHVVQVLVRLVGNGVQPQFGALPDRPAERVRAASLTEPAAALGWLPHTRLEEGLRRTVDWYRKALTRSLGESRTS
jgi:UDP-glucose 4-epimerase